MTIIFLIVTVYLADRAIEAQKAKYSAKQLEKRTATSREMIKQNWTLNEEKDLLTIEGNIRRVLISVDGNVLEVEEIDFIEA